MEIGCLQKVTRKFCATLEMSETRARAYPRPPRREKGRRSLQRSFQSSKQIRMQCGERHRESVHINSALSAFMPWWCLLWRHSQRVRNLGAQAAESLRNTQHVTPVSAHAQHAALQRYLPAPVLLLHPAPRRSRWRPHSPPPHPLRPAATPGSVAGCRTA